MGRSRDILIGGLGALLAAALFGFVLFAGAATRAPLLADKERADGVVVLTGADLRIAQGAQLLREGRARRLLISGVNRKTSRDDVMRIAGLPPAQFDCCVDLGYEALDTFGNAGETKSWMALHRFNSVIVVTSSYHMPRALAELTLAMPHTTLIPHRVTPKAFPQQVWWLSPGAVRILFAEYVKFMPTAARMLAARVTTAWDGNSLADVPQPRAKL